MARTKKDPEPKTPNPDEIIALFSEKFVDLEVFAQGATSYEVTDVTGKKRTYELPNDPAFPMALAFQRAHDRYYRAMFEVGKARGKAQEALLDKVEAAWSDLVGRPAEVDPATGQQIRPERSGAFLDLVRIRQPELTVEEFRDSIGAAFMQNWMETVTTRLQIARLSGDFNSALSLLARAMKENADGGPKANGSASTTSSDTSAG